MKKVLALLLAIGLVFALAGCSGEEEDAPQAGMSRPEDGRYKFCASYPSISDGYYSLVNAGIRTVVQAGEDSLVTLDPGFDAAAQADQIMDMLTEEGIDVMFIAPIDEATLQPVLEALRAASVPIINICTPLAKEDSADYTVYADYNAGGARCAEDLALREAGGGTYLVLENGNTVEEDASLDGWARGLKGGEAVFEEVGKYDCQGSEENAYGIVSGFFAESGSNISAIFSTCDAGALGAIRAMQDAGLREQGILVYCTGGSPEVRRAVNSTWLTATAAQNPYSIGEKSATLAYQMLEGETPGAQLLVEMDYIDAESLPSYKIESWG